MENKSSDESKTISQNFLRPVENKRKKNYLSIAQKILILGDIEKGQSERIICEKYSTSKGAVTRIKKDKEKLLQMQIQVTNEQSLDKRSKINGSASKMKIEEEIVNKIDILINKGIPLSSHLIKNIACNTAEENNVKGFKGSDGWFARFKTRNNIYLKKIHGERKSADSIAAESYKEKIIELLKDFDCKDVFNADETSLFYKAFPTRTYVRNSKSVSGEKMEKEKITLLLGCSLVGEKLAPLVIGKSKSPRCFSGVNLSEYNIIYRNSSKAWMNRNIFTEWLSNLNLMYRKQNRKILLFIDNAPCHINPELSNITIEFLPKNTTSIIQPCDQGIIKTFKTFYRHYQIEEIANTILLSGSKPKITLLKAIQWILLSWDNVSISTITNCFFHTGLFVYYKNKLTTSIIDIVQISDNTKNEVSNSESNKYINSESTVEKIEEPSTMSNIVNRVFKEAETESDTENVLNNIKVNLKNLKDANYDVCDIDEIMEIDKLCDCDNEIEIEPKIPCATSDSIQLTENTDIEDNDFCEVSDSNVIFIEESTQIVEKRIMCNLQSLEKDMSICCPDSIKTLMDLKSKFYAFLRTKKMRQSRIDDFFKKIN